MTKPYRPNFLAVSSGWNNNRATKDENEQKDSILIHGRNLLFSLNQCIFFMAV